MTKPGKTIRPWTPHEWGRALAMAEQDVPREDIAAALNRSVQAVLYRFHYFKKPLPPSRAQREMDAKRAAANANINKFGNIIHRVPPELLDDRARRSDARMRQSLTGLAFGDPPPGYSALDQQRGGHR